MMLKTLFGKPEERVQATVWGTWPGDTPMMVSGEPAVNTDTSMQLLTVAGCVRMITDSIATMPIDVFRTTNGERVNIPTPMWLREPTLDLDYTAWCTQILTSLLLHGNAYVAVTRSGTSIVELLVIDPSRVDVKRDGARLVYLMNGVPFPGELRHLKGMMLPGSDKGLSPLEYARRTIGLGLSAVEFGVDQLNNANNMPGVIESPGTMQPEEMTQMARAWQRARSKKNRGLPGVLQAGAQWKPTGVTNEQAQFLQTQKWNGAQIAANVFLVDPTDLGIPVEGSNHTYANLEQRNLRRLQVTFLPWIIRLEKFMSALLPQPQYAKVNVDGLLKADSIARWTIYTQGMAINQQAAALGQPPVITTPEMRDFEDWGPVKDTFAAPEPVAAPADAQMNAAELIQKIYLGVGSVVTIDEARDIVSNLTGTSLPNPAPDSLVPTQTKRSADPPVVNVKNDVHVPEQRMPDPAPVTVNSPVTVHVPEQPAAPVNITMPSRATTRSVERDEAGNITRIVEE